MVSIGNRGIGDEHRVFITLEAGPTHNGVDSAMRLVDLAAAAGGDAIKFQILDAERLVRDPRMMVSYGYLSDRDSKLIETFEEPQLEILRRRALTRDEWSVVKSRADSHGLSFFATVSFVEEIEFVVELGCPSIKIASLDVNHFPLIRQAAAHDVCIQLDTGSSTIGEIESAVDTMADIGKKNFILHHCPSGYPARLESINLRTIPTLKQMFGCPVAFSDHTPGWDMDIAAVSLGANLIEKTITEDRTQRSPEHVMSLEKEDVGAFVRAIRELEVALGATRRIMGSAEKERRAKRRRSAYSNKAYPAGTPVVDMDIDFARPGNGIGPDILERFSGACLSRDVEIGELLTFEHLRFID